ncbi:MAG: hypothetical protein KKE76_09875 [Gammaproteobacteria bacterium]|nr:hypothetical protein [Gammaproteobacteria bacterium]
MKRSRHSIYCLLFILSGCAGVPEHIDYEIPFQQVAQNLNGAVECCSGFKDFSYESISMPYKMDISIDQSSPVYSFSTGKSYFRAFKFPTDVTHLVMTVRSHPVWIGRDKPREFFFKPAVLLLNEKFESTRLVESDFTDYVQHDKKYYLEGALEFDPQETPYGILLTTDKLRKFYTMHSTRGSTSILPLSTGSGMVFLPMDSPGLDFLYYHSEVGLMEVMIH